MKTNFTVGKKTWFPVLPFVVLIATLGLLVGNAQARINVVGGITPGNSGNINCNGNPQSNQNGYATIQAAINASSSGDTIVVCPGTYSENNIAVNKSNLTLVSKDTDAATVTVQHTSSNPYTPLVIVSQPNVVLRAINFVSRYSYPAIRATSAATTLWLDAIRASSSNDAIDLQANNARISSLTGTSTGAYVGVVNLNNTTGFVMDGTSTLTATANSNGRGIWGGTGTANSPAISGATINAGGYGIYLPKAGTLTISNTSVAATNGYGIYAAGGSGNHVLTNLTVAGTSGYGVYIDGGTTAVLTDVDASSNQNYSGALHFLNISGGVTVAKSAKATLTYNNPANNGYGIYLENSPGLTLSNATITTGSLGIYQKGSNGGRFVLNNVNVTASRNTGIYIEGGSGAHTFNFMSISGQASNSGGMYLNGGTSATFTDVDAVATGGSGNYGSALTVRGITGSISVDKAAKSGVSFTGPANTYGLFLCPASGSNATVQVANATVSAGLVGVYVGYSDCGNSTVTLRNLAVTSSGSHGILVSHGVGNHVLDNITSTGNGPGQGNGIQVDGGSGVTLTDVDATVSGNGNWQSVLYINAIAGPVSIGKSAKSSVSYTGTGTNVYGVRVCNASNGTLTMRNAVVRSYQSGLYIGGGSCANGAMTLSNLDIVSSNGHGIDASARGTHSVDSIVASGDRYGIRIDGTGISNSTNSTYSNLTATSGSSGTQYVYGLYLGWQSGARLTGTNTITGMGRDNVGIYLDACSSCTVSGATIDMTSQTGYTRGISLINSSNNSTVTGNYIKNAYAEGIYANSSNPSVIGNIVENSARQSWTYGIKMEYTGPAYNNCLYNTSNGYGTRFYDSTTQTGNFWGSWPKGTGYSDTCTDANSDGRCDTRYSYQSGNYDEYPLKRCNTPMPGAATLIAHYRMEDPSWNGTAGEWKDISGNNYHGTTGASTNAPRPTLQTASPAKPGDPGTCGYGYVPPQAGSGDGTAAFTTATLPVSTAAGAKTSVSFWMKWNGTSDVSFVRWDKYALYLRDGIFGFTTSNWSLDRYGTNSLPANQWVHVVAVFVNGDVQSSELYLNGVKKTLSAAPASSFSNADAYVTPTLKVAWQAYNDFWRYRGDIDEVKVFNGQLTQDQVTALYSETHVCPSVKLIADWRMDETAWNGTSGEVADSSGNNLNGQAKSGATLATTATAKLCQGGVFDNQNYVELPDSGSLQVTTSYTIAAWIKTSKGAATIVSKTGSSSPWLGYVFALGPNSGGKLSLWNGSGSWYTSSGAAVNDGAWHHVAATVNGNSLQFYVDGVSNGSAITLAAVTTASSSPLRVGFENSPDASTRYFSGQMDEVKIWSGALTATQIATGYANEAANKNWDGSARSCQAMLVADWRMDESGWNGTAGEIKDASASAYHGTATGATTATGKICRAGDLSATGTSDYLKYPYQALHGRDAFSVALWFKTAVSKSQQELLQGLGSSTSDDQIEIYLVNGTQVVVNVRDTGNTTFTAPGSLTNNAWHHLAFTRAGASGCLYIDGALVECKTTYPTGALVINSNALLSGQEQDSYGGGFNTGQALEGHIDELKVWDGTLSAAQVTAGYANESAGKNWDGSARTCLSLSAHYKFDDTWGPGDTLDDSSGKNKPASLNGTVMQEAAPAVGIKPATCKAGNFNKAGWFSTASGLDIDTATNGKNSVSFWMYWDGGFSSTNFTMPFSWGGVYYDLAVSKYRSEMGNGVIGFNTGNGDVYGVTADGLANGWHHVAAVFNNGSVTQNKLYIDGVQKTLTSYSSHSDRSATTAAAGIGAGANWGGDYKWSGKLDNVKIYKGEIDSAQIAADKAETLSCAALDHIRIEAGTTGLTCQREAVTFKACQDAASCATLYTGGDAQINLAPTGKWYAAASGGAALTDPQTIPTAGTLTLYLQQTTATTVDVNAVSAGGPAPSGTPTVTCNTDTTAAPCAIAFADKGLIFTADKTTGLETTIPPQISGTESGQLYVSAAKDDGDGQCVSAVSGGTATIGYTCIDPGTCSSGTDWLATAGTLTFDTNGYADFKFTYKDAGKIQLTATTTAGGVTLTGNSNSFVVKPAALCVYSTDIAACTKPAGSEHECSKVKKAGETFNLTVTAVRSGYDCASASTYATPNYKATGITLGSVTVAPDTDVETPGVTTLNITSGGSAAVDQSIKEVGVFQFSAKPPTPYIDGGVDIGGPFWTSNLGRFYPDHFDVSPNTPKFKPGCETTFTYVGQPFQYDTQPVLTVTAKNTNDDPTKNYKGDFWKLTNTTLTGRAYTVLAGSLNTSGLPDPAVDPVIVANGDGTGTLTFGSGTGLRFVRSTTPVAPFNAEISLSINVVDGDGVGYKTEDTSVTPKIYKDANPARFGQATAGDGMAFGTGKTQRFGVLRLDNAYGSELLAIRVPVRALYCNAITGTNCTEWRTNTDDTCTRFTSSDASLPNYQGLNATNFPLTRWSASLSRTDPIGTGTGVTPGQGVIVLNPPSPTATGSVDLLLTVPVWLQGSWDSDGLYDDNPTARIKFGSPKAPYIYMRERY